MSKLYNSAGSTLSLEEVEKLKAMASITLEYGRTQEAGYYLLRIPKYTLEGKRLMPKVAITSADGSVGGEKVSTLAFAKRENTVFAMNAGLFNTTTMTPQGQTIIEGLSVTNSPMTDDMGTAISDAECYPLCIDAEGNLSAPYGRTVDTAEMLADGVCYAVTAWGQFIGDFVPSGTDKFSEIVHPDTYIRQCIGQYDNGDYLVCTVDKARLGIAANDAGMTYDTLASLLVSKGVKFAYSLDGGGSCETVLGKRQINPVYEGTSGRPVPTVIYFEVE